MSWVSTAARRSQLRGMISDYTNKLTRITDDLRNLQTYSSATSDGLVTYDELGDLSADYHETAYYNSLCPLSPLCSLCTSASTVDSRLAEW